MKTAAAEKVPRLVSIKHRKAAQKSAQCYQTKTRLNSLYFSVIISLPFSLAVFTLVYESYICIPKDLVWLTRQFRQVSSEERGEKKNKG